MKQEGKPMTGQMQGELIGMMQFRDTLIAL